MGEIEKVDDQPRALIRIRWPKDGMTTPNLGWGMLNCSLAAYPRSTSNQDNSRSKPTAQMDGRRSGGEPAGVQPNSLTNNSGPRPGL